MIRRRHAPRAGALAATAALVLLPTPAVAQPILAPEEAAELAENLAEASERQGICYGWEVNVEFEDGSSRADVGSGAGPGTSTRNCASWMLLAGKLVYVPESSESEDSASILIESNLESSPGKDDLRDLGISERNLLGENGDITLFNAVAALPLLAAQAGLAPYLPLEPNSIPIPGEDELTGKPGSDITRTYWPLLALASLALLVGLVGIVLTLIGVLPPSGRGRDPRGPGRGGQPRTPGPLPPRPPDPAPETPPAASATPLERP